MNPEPNEITLIIGGAGGIGSAIAERYVSSGHRLLVADIDTSKGTALSENLGPLASFGFLDATSPESIDSLRSRLEEESASITSLISLGGKALDSDFQGLAMSATEIQKSIHLNLTSHVMAVAAFAPLMKADGAVTLVSSINAIGNFGLPAYSSAKAGLIGLVKSSAQELGARGIRINAVLPGTVPTPATELEPKNFDKLLETSLLGRFATPSDIARTVHELSEHLTAITGQTLIVDCGQSLGRR